MKIFALIVFFALGAFGLYLDVLNLYSMFGAFGVVLGLGVGLGKIGLPFFAYSNKGKDDQFAAICWLVWCCLVVASGFNTVQFVKATAAKKMLLSPEHLALQKDIDFYQSEIDSAIAARKEINKSVSPTAYRKATEQIETLNKSKSDKQAEFNGLKVEDITANDFIKNQDLIGWAGAFALEILTILFGIGARKEDENTQQNNTQDNSQLLLIQLLSDISNKLNNIENKQDSFSLPAPVAAFESDDKSIESSAFKSAFSLASTELQAHDASTQKSAISSLENASTGASKLAASNAARAKKAELENIEMARLILAMNQPSERELMRKFKIGEPRLKKILLIVDELKNKEDNVVSLF